MITSVKRKAIFLDKDGTIIPNIHFNVNPDLITFGDEVKETLLALRSEGYLLVIISNQTGVAKGLFSESDLGKVWQKLDELLEDEKGFDGFYYCPHDKDGIVQEFSITCNCHKPLPGLIQQGAKELHIDLKNSWMVGDILNDVEAGNRAGCNTVLFDVGNETEWRKGEFRNPDFTIKKFSELQAVVLKSKKFST